MSDERFELDLAAVLHDIAGDEAPASLRYRLRSITDAPTAVQRGWFAPLLQLSAAAAIVVAVAAFGWIFLHGPIVSTSPTPTPGPTSSAPAPTMSPGPTPSPSPSPAPSPSASPQASGWTGLTWSDGEVPSSAAGIEIDGMVAWHGEYIGVGGTGRSEESNGQGAFFSSTDGVRWTVVQTIDLRPDRHLNRVMVIGDRLLAIVEIWSVDCPAGTVCPTPDFAPELWTSTDGSHWTTVVSPSWHDTWSPGGLRWVVAGDAGITAVGYEAQVREMGQPLPAAIPLVVHSDDGVTWEKADLTQGFSHAVFRDAVAFSGGFVIVGRDGVPDPTTEVVDPANPLPLGVGRPAAWVSADGIHWTVATVDGIEIEGGELSRVVVGADGLFAIGAGSPSAGDATPSGWTSNDGATWHVVGRLGSELPAVDQASSQVPVFGDTVLASDGRHIVILDREAPGSDAMAAWVSTDGATWVPLAFAGSTSLPKIGYYQTGGSQGMYLTGATVLSDRIVVSGYGDATYRLWLAMAVSP